MARYWQPLIVLMILATNLWWTLPLTAAPPLQSSPQSLSSLPFAATNGHGPVERNQSNGGAAAGDGGQLRLDGQVYDRGLGVAAESDIRFDLAGRCQWFSAMAGIEDGTTGTAVFVIYLDNQMIASSGEVSSADPAMRLSFSVAGVQQLRLRLTSYDRPEADRGIWADPRVTCSERLTLDPTSTVPPIPPTAVPATATSLPVVPTAVPTRQPLPSPMPSPTLPPGGGSTTVATWSRWEQRLTSQRVYPSPITDVRLRATFVGPDGTSFSSDGVWDGGSSFVIRTQFPRAGTWIWQTSSSDAGLHGQRGIVQVAAGTRTTFERRGALRVADNGHLLTYAGGTPFFWLGDTAWDAPLQANDDEWRLYLADRARKGFSVVQIAIAPSWSGAADRQGFAPFVGGNLRQPNLLFWRGLERKIQLANEAGLVVLLVGVMDPLAQNQTDYAAAQALGRFVAARLAGAQVILSPTFDHPYWDMADQTATALREAAPWPLVIQHPDPQRAANQ